MNRTLRIILDIVIVLAIIQGWWFVALPLALIGTCFAGYFMEIILAGIMYDALFGMSPALGIWGYAGIIVTTIAFAAITLVKRVLR